MKNYLILKISALFLIMFFFLSNSFSQTRNLYKINAIKAYLFIDQSETEHDNTMLFTENVITDSINQFFNAVIEVPTRHTLVVVELIDESDIIGDDGKLKFTVYGFNNRLILSQTQEFIFLSRKNTVNLPFFISDAGCEVLKIKAELIVNNKIVQTKEERITFECGE